MKVAALIDGDLEPPLDGFIETPAPARKASKPAKKPVPVKVRWLDQMVGIRLPAMAVQAAILLAGYYDDKLGYAYPPQKRLVARLNASRSGVRLAIKCLEDAGYLEVIALRGRPRKEQAYPNNRYFLRFPEPKNGH
jgi:hypothetical protein